MFPEQHPSSRPLARAGTGPTAASSTLLLKQLQAKTLICSKLSWNKFTGKALYLTTAWPSFCLDPPTSSDLFAIVGSHDLTRGEFATLFPRPTAAHKLVYRSAPAAQPLILRLNNSCDGGKILV